MKTLIILMLLVSLGACKKSGDSASKDPKSPPNNPTPEPPLQGCSDTNFGFNGGDGSEESPYLIHTYAQLKMIKCNPKAHYKLEQDIDASPSWSEGESGCTAYDGSTVPEFNACTGWVPVGDYEADKCDGETDDVCFQGHLDGGGHVISNLYMNFSGSTSDVYSGLFGQIGEQSYISHIGLVDVSITAINHSFDFYVGGLVGYSEGTIINSYVTGSSTFSSSALSAVDSSHVFGGLVGRNQGSIFNSYAIVVFSLTSSSHPKGGGLVGHNYGGVIYNSYAAGTVSHSSSIDTYIIIGGLVGHNEAGIIHSSYATGTVSSDHSGANKNQSASIGGLVGSHDWLNAIISNSYTTGTVTASCTQNNCGVDSGGLIGQVYQGGSLSGTAILANFSFGYCNPFQGVLEKSLRRLLS